MDSGVRDLLVSMKSELSKGWTQGELENDEGVCLFGALVISGDVVNTWGTCGSNNVKGRSDNPYVAGPMYRIHDDTKEAEALGYIATEVGVKSIRDLALWNDAKGRTVDDVINAIDNVLLKNPRPRRRLKNLFRREMAHA